MSRKNTHETVFVTVEPPVETKKLLFARVSNILVLFALLLLNHYADLHVPESLWWMFGGAATGLELPKLLDVVKGWKK